jgi:hypothetical protein
VIGAAANPDVTAVIGATGSGKTTWLKRALLTPRPRRLLIWDDSPVEEYRPWAHYMSLPEMIDEAYAAKGGPFGLAVVPNDDTDRKAAQFDIFCRLAWNVGRCTVLVEELSYITKPSWGPGPWRQLIRKGRKQGLQIIGTTQRPADVDKIFYTQATRIHTGMLGSEPDRKAIGAELGVEPDALKLLPLEYIDFDRRTRQLERGKLTF